MKYVSFLVGVFALSTTALAQPKKKGFGHPQFGEVGCSADSVSVVVSEDQSTMSLLFDDFVVEADEETRFDISACTISVPIDVPEGHRLTSVEIDYRGYMEVQEDAVGRFGGTYRINGKKWEHEQDVFEGPFEDDFFVTHSLEGPSKGKKWGCGDREVDFQIRARLSVRKPPHSDLEQYAYAAVDSGDMTADIQLGIHTEKCESGGGGHGGGGHAGGGHGGGHGHGHGHGGNGPDKPKKPKKKKGKKGKKK